MYAVRDAVVIDIKEALTGVVGRGGRNESTREKLNVYYIFAKAHDGREGKLSGCFFYINTANEKKTNPDDSIIRFVSYTICYVPNNLRLISKLRYKSYKRPNVIKIRSA